MDLTNKIYKQLRIKYKEKFLFYSYMSSESLVLLMEKCKDQYYEGEKKNYFFKKGQKLDCAKKISETFPMEDILKTTVYIIPNTNKIIFNYTIFKLYANESVYNTVIQKVLELYEILINSHNGFEIHVILDTFTITAAERYKNVIKTFCELCTKSPINYTKYLQCMYIYYTPSMIESISVLLKPFLDPSLSERVIYYSKAESPALLEEIHKQK